MHKDDRSAASARWLPTWKERAILLAAGVPTVTTGLLYYETLRYVPNSIAIVLLFQFTWMGILIQAIRQRRRPTGIMLCALAILLFGTLFAAGIVDQQLAVINGLGFLFGISSAVSYSLYILVNGHAVPTVHPFYRSAWMITGGMLFVFAMFPPTYLFSGTLLNELLPYGLMLGLAGVCLPMILFTFGIPHIGEGLTGILGAIELPVAVLLSSVILHEHVSAFQWVGVVVVLLGVAFPELGAYRRQRMDI